MALSISLKESSSQLTIQEEDGIPGQRGGFDCQFVDPPPDIIQTECPVCLLIIREPHQVICCGNSFCSSCIQRIKHSNKPCPTCSKIEFSDFPDKQLQRSLNTFKVYCSHQKDGCEWTGELGQLDTHLNEDPEPEKELEGCQFVEIHCFFKCGGQFQRHYINEHQFTHCNKRPFSCEHCHNYDANYDDVTQNHWPVCGSFPLHCPNQCGVELPRQKIDNHIDNKCPLKIIHCSFLQVGCKVKLPRKDMPEHLSESLLTHMSLLAASYAKQQTEIIEHQAEIAKQQSEIVDLQAQIASLTAEKTLLRTVQVKSACNLLRDEVTLLKKELVVLGQELKSKEQSTYNPILGLPTVSMANFKQHREDSDTWYSPPVYTHQMGYKLCFIVDASGYGSGKGTHVSVGLSFMRGEFDNFLKWPFRGVISFRLLDRYTGKDHISRDIVCDEKMDDKFASRVTKREMSKLCVSTPRFISHTELEPKYLVDDSLCFQFYKVELK